MCIISPNMNRLKYEHEYEAKLSILDLFLLLFHSSEIMSRWYHVSNHNKPHAKASPFSYIARCSKIPAMAQNKHNDEDGSETENLPIIGAHTNDCSSIH